jgi:hypothetical protein
VPVLTGAVNSKKGNGDGKREKGEELRKGKVFASRLSLLPW